MLAEAALEFEDVGFIHLISGQDFPLKTNKEFKDLALKRRDFLECFPLPPDWLDRYNYYCPYDFIDAKRHGRLIGSIVKIQKRIRFTRAPLESRWKLYGGSTWWSLTRETLQYVVEQTRGDSTFLRRLDSTFCAEEIYFQTIIVNSQRSSNVYDDNLRLIDWSSGRGGYPAILDESHFEVAISGNRLFGRKVESPTSDELVAMLRRHILES